MQIPGVFSIQYADLISACSLKGHRDQSKNIRWPMKPVLKVPFRINLFSYPFHCYHKLTEYCRSIIKLTLLLSNLGDNCWKRKIDLLSHNTTHKPSFFLFFDIDWRNKISRNCKF